MIVEANEIIDKYWRSAAWDGSSVSKYEFLMFSHSEPGHVITFEKSTFHSAMLFESICRGRKLCGERRNDEGILAAALAKLE